MSEEIVVEVSEEEARGCGFRKTGPDGVGLYLMGNGIFVPCERLPFPLDVCPCCGAGTKFSRGFTWIVPRELFNPYRIPRCADIPGLNHVHHTCYMCSPPDGRQGLIWVGEKFYSPSSFALEAATRGVSKRIAGVPKGFEIGQNFIYLAHKKVIKGESEDGNSVLKPAVFMAFKPLRLDIVVDTTNVAELPSRALSLKKKFGDLARLVKVEPTFEQGDLLQNTEPICQ